MQGLPGIITGSRDPASSSGSAYVAIGNEVVTMVGGDYIARDENPGAHIAIIPRK